MHGECTHGSDGSLEAGDFRLWTRKGSFQNTGIWAGYSGTRVSRKVNKLKKGYLFLPCELSHPWISILQLWKYRDCLNWFIALHQVITSQGLWEVWTSLHDCYGLVLAKLLGLVAITNTLMGLTTESLLTVLCMFELRKQLEVFLVTNWMAP